MHTRTRITVAALALWTPFGLPAAAARSQFQDRGTATAARIDSSLAAAARYLLRNQSSDGAWRSKTYACFKDGPSLTGLVLSAMFFMPQGGKPAMKQSFKRGADYLVRMVGEDGSIEAGEHGLNFPVLSAASASRVVVLLEKTPANLAAQQVWLKFMRSYQLNEKLGWSPSDPQFGGWGFSIKPPRKPKPGEIRESFAESNMVATIFAIGALRSAKIPADDPVWDDVLTFVVRCQNYADGAPDVRFDDGGFFFIPMDPVQNKAGVAGIDAHGRTRFHSYGSMTADGLRALARCGLPSDHPRVQAARRWLLNNLSAQH
ncbi:MAG: hypothetical protein ACP5R5_12340, partial [Armatimonadota bacterium]